MEPNRALELIDVITERAKHSQETVAAALEQVIGLERHVRDGKRKGFEVPPEHKAKIEELRDLWDGRVVAGQKNLEKARQINMNPSLIGTMVTDLELRSEVATRLRVLTETWSR